jgi:hypothetical protein
MLGLLAVLIMSMISKVQTVAEVKHSIKKGKGIKVSVSEAMSSNRGK